MHYIEKLNAQLSIGSNVGRVCVGGRPIFLLFFLQYGNSCPWSMVKCNFDCGQYLPYSEEVQAICDVLVEFHAKVDNADITNNSIH